MKFIKITEEDYPSVSSLYDDIQQAFIAETSNPNILPDIDYLTPKFKFSKYLIPPNSSAMHQSGLTN